MKVLLLNGSPHAQGCTYTALCEVAGALEKNGIETEIFHIGTKPIAGCIACGSCLKTGKCVFDDGVNEFVEKAAEGCNFPVSASVGYAIGERKYLEDVIAEADKNMYMCKHKVHEELSF